MNAQRPFAVYLDGCTMRVLYAVLLLAIAGCGRPVPDSAKPDKAVQDGVPRFEQRHRFQDPRGIWAAAFSLKGDLVAIGGESGNVAVIGTSDGKPRFRLPAHSKGVHSIAFSLDGDWAATGGEDEFVNIWSMHDGSLGNRIPIPEGKIKTALAFNPDGTLLAVGRSDGSVRVANVRTGETVREIRHAHDQIADIAFSSDGLSLVVAAYVGRIGVWESTGRGDPTLEYNGVSGPACVGFNSRNSPVAMLRRTDGSVMVWRPDLESPVKNRFFSSSVLALRMSADGKWFAAGLADGTTRLESVLSGARGDLPMENMRAGAVRLIAISFSGRHLLVAHQNGEAQLYEQIMGDR